MSANRTMGVKNLVRDVLAIFPKPYGEDIILDVCMADRSTGEGGDGVGQLA